MGRHRQRRVWAVLWTALCVTAPGPACVALEAPETALNCTDCIPMCAAGHDVDTDDYAASAQRLGCEPDLVTGIFPIANEQIRDERPEIRIEFAQAPRLPHEAGEGCSGPLRVTRVGRVGDVPGLVSADIVTRASITTLPVWPPDRECIEGRWRLSDRTLRFVPDAALQELTWYEVTVPADLPFPGTALCSELAFRFSTSACGNGRIEQADSFIDWICLGHVEAENGYFLPYEEECDDGNRQGGDACSASCVRELGWDCDGDGCRTRCGDGIRAGEEQCDLGKTLRPGCDAQCRTQPGFRCDSSSCWASNSGAY